MNLPEKSRLVIRSDLEALSCRLEDPAPITARDWKTFFAGLAELLSVLLPVILPLFVADDEEETV